MATGGFRVNGRFPTHLLVVLTTSGRDPECPTWNVDKGLRPNQVPVLERAEQDIVALQEVSTSHVTSMMEAFGQLGLPFVVHTLTRKNRFPFALLLAPRWPVERVNPPGLVLQYMERAWCALIETPIGKIEVMSVQFPPGTMKVNGRAIPDAKIGTFQGLMDY